MKTRNRNRLFVVMVMATALLAGVAGPVAAQNATNATTTTADAPSAEPGSTHVVNKDLGGVELVSWTHLGDGRIRFKFDSGIPTRVSITDASGLSEALSEGEGARTEEIHSRSMTIVGSETVEFSATVVDSNAAVTIGADRLVAIRTGAVSSGGGRPPVKFTFAAGAILATFGGTAFTTFRVARDKYDEEGETWARRIA